MSVKVVSGGSFTCTTTSTSVVETFKTFSFGVGEELLAHSQRHRQEREMWGVGPSDDETVPQCPAGPARVLGAKFMSAWPPLGWSDRIIYCLGVRVPLMCQGEGAPSRIIMNMMDTLWFSGGAEWVCESPDNLGRATPATPELCVA